MKLPKLIDQKFFMGKPCWWDGEYYRSSGKKKIVNNEFGFGGYPDTDTITPIKWKVQKHLQKVGWIVGFGFCFNGSIVKTGEGEFSFKHFRATKRVNYVRIRETPQGKELKIPLRNLRFKRDKK